MGGEERAIKDYNGPQTATWKATKGASELLKGHGCRPQREIYG
jgi:hypothetical protein